MRTSGVPDLLEGVGEGRVEVEGRAGRVGHPGGDVVLVADDLVLEGFGEGAGDGAGHRGDQADPVAGQPRGEDRYGQDEPLGQPVDAGVAAHHVEVGEDVGAADVEGSADLGRHPGAADQVAQHVADGDGLDTGAHPAGGDHHGQPLGQVAEHLEGGRAGADDDGGAEHRGGDPGGQEDAPDLGAGAQMGRELAVGHPARGESAQVDDAADAGGAGLLGEVPRGQAVGVLEVAPGAEGVHEVVGDVDAPQGGGERRGVGDVAADDLRLPGPGVVAQFLRSAGEAAHPVAGGDELGDEPAADVTGGSGDQAQRARGRGSLCVRHRVAPIGCRGCSPGVLPGVRSGRMHGPPPTS